MSTPTTFWNFTPAVAARGAAVVHDDGTFPLAWYHPLDGQRIPVVRVTYGGEEFYLDDRDGAGWDKVTCCGGPQHPHRNVTVVDFEEGSVGE